MAVRNVPLKMKDYVFFTLRLELSSLHTSAMRVSKKGLLANHNALRLPNSQVYRNAAGSATTKFLSRAHRFKMETAYHRNLGLKTLWICWNYQIRGLGFLVLHILMAIVVGLETYPGGLSKPGPVVAVTVIVVLAKLAVFLRLYYLAPDPGRYHASARNYLIRLACLRLCAK